MMRTWKYLVNLFFYCRMCYWMSRGAGWPVWLCLLRIKPFGKRRRLLLSYPGAWKMPGEYDFRGIKRP